MMLQRTEKQDGAAGTVPGTGDISLRMKAMRICVVIPTYNNERTVAEVVNDVMAFCEDIIVVNDGSTDSTAGILSRFGDSITCVSYPVNRGKGYALRKGFDKAREMGFEHAITLDSDGQHYADDMPLFVEAAEAAPGVMVIGSRGLKHDNMPAGNTFANRFSNFWFAVQTFRRLPDTQTGYRLYPIARMRRMRFLTTRYEAELEMMVRLAWRLVPMIPVGIKVYYAPAGERMSHFRKGKDFARITVLNTCLCVLAVLWGYPSMLVRGIGRLFRSGT